MYSVIYILIYYYLNIINPITKYFIDNQIFKNISELILFCNFHKYYFLLLNNNKNP